MLLVLPIVVLSVLSCGEDEIVPIQITAEEFVVNIEENPEVGATIGTIIASTTRGDLSFEMMTQDPVDALIVDPISGEISVGDATFFDFEERRFTTAVIMVFNEDKEDAIVARVNVLNAFENPKFESLVGHFSLDEEATDLSTFGNDGSVLGAMPTADINGDSSGALMFDGEENMVVIPHKDQYNITSELTVSVLVKVLEKKNSRILRKGTTNGNNKSPYTISMFNGVIEFDLAMVNGNGSGNLSYDLQSNMYELDEWTMITGVLSGDKMYLYLNGVLVEEGDAPGVLNTNSDEMFIGNSFKGAIDDVRLYDAALTAKEIRELYNNYSL